jgi:hypothetical protein
MAKLPAGILSGNINWMGDYGQCRDVFNDESPFFQKEPLQGKYCRADIKLPFDQISVNKNKCLWLINYAHKKTYWLYRSFMRFCN